MWIFISIADRGNKLRIRRFRNHNADKISKFVLYFFKLNNMTKDFLLTSVISFEIEDYQKLFAIIYTVRLYCDLWIHIVDCKYNANSQSGSGQFKNHQPDLNEHSAKIPIRIQRPKNHNPQSGSARLLLKVKVGAKIC